MKSEVLLEQDVRDEFRKRWCGWLETYQPARGSGAGVPDTQIMANPPLLVPIELKRGELINGRLVSDDVRPQQVSWHTRFHEAGGRSFFVIGAGTPKKVLFFFAEAMLVLATRKQGLLAPSNGCFLLPTDSNVTKQDSVFTQALKGRMNR